MPICKTCNIEKDKSLFFKSRNNKNTGIESSCKKCRTESILKRKEIRFSNSPEAKERFRVSVLNGAKKYSKKYPEKSKAKDAARKIRNQNPLIDLHHWSYNEEHYLDVIEMNKYEHIGFHKFIKYDKEKKMYLTHDYTLLDTKEKHLEYFNKVRHLIGIK